ncbi:MAG: concanavalin A-like lectin/glucanase domain-containing protein, partial [Piptocephalis tieghemiana]
MASWTETQRLNHVRAFLFAQDTTPASEIHPFSSQDVATIHDRGVRAWRFLPDPPQAPAPVSTVLVHDQCELTFLGQASGEPSGSPFPHQPQTVMTNLPLPKAQEVYYFEVKLMDLPPGTNVAIGLVTRPYPGSFCLPGQAKYSVGMDSDRGHRFYSTSFSGLPHGCKSYEGDVLGCGYRPRSGTVFFTRNGVKLDPPAFTGFRPTSIFPAVGAQGPCHLEVNLGQAGFVLIEANVKKWGLAPVIEAPQPPPAYGKELGSVLLQ